MDKTKQPGISFDGIMLVKEEFWRDYIVPDDIDMDLKFESSNQIVDNRATSEVTSTLKLIANGQDVIKLESKFVGFFSIDENEKNMDLDNYMKINSAALMFPYIREHITTITAKAGINPIMLPPLNLIAILNNEER